MTGDRLTADQSAYQAILGERYRLVACPRCGAKRNERCIGQYGRRIKGVHWRRKDAAATAGYVLGRCGNIERVRAWGRLLRDLAAMESTTELAAHPSRGGCGG